MNLLCDKAPDTITVSGVEYKINSDFRVWIKFELILTVQVDNTISAEILAEIQQLIFKAPCPMNEETVEAILNFYRCGKPPEKHSGGGDEKAVFSYDFDDGYIYAAFKEQYGIDLNDANLHWWKFRALFQSLNADCMFVKILGYRSMPITSKMSTADRNFYQRMKKLYALPLPQSVQEKYNAIEDALINGKTIDNLL
ncbi:MAG TPA: hypothetical protein DEP65_08690 [Ruminococcus sp.]|nr:hypothetical protein [Ruminococcus sp.]